MAITSLVIDYSGLKYPKITEIAEFAKFSSRKNKVVYSSPSQVSTTKHVSYPHLTATGCMLASDPLVGLTDYAEISSS